MSKYGSRSWRLAGSLLMAFALAGCGGGGGGGTTPLTIAYDVPELMYYTFDGSGTSVPNLASAPVGPWASAEIEGGMTQGGILGQFSGGLNGTGGASYLDRLNTGWATNLSGDWTIALYLDNVPSTIASYVFGDYDAAEFRCLTGGTSGTDLILKGLGINDVVATNAAVSGPTVTHFVYDSSGPAILAYVNGVFVPPAIGQLPLTINAFPGGGPFLVGGYSPNPGLNAGSILDEFRLYNRALDAAEIAATWDQSLPVFN